METASRRRVRALPGARLAVRALAALLTGTLGMETAPAVPQAGRMLLASEGGAQAARERLACAGTQHLVLSPEALVGVEQLDAKGQRARTDADLLAATGSACCIELRGGDLASWWGALFPGTERSRLGRALYTHWRRGTPVVGVGAGAAFLCAGGPATTGPWPLEENDREDARVEGRALTGLGMGPLPLLAWGSGASAGPGALLDSMERYGLEAGAWFEGSVHAEFLPERREVTVRGPGRLCLLVLDGPHRARQIVGPLWQLGDGCRWEPWRKRVHAPKGAVALEGVEEELLLGRHRLEVWSRSGSREHQALGCAASRILLAVRLVRSGLVGHDRLPEPRDR